MAAVAIPTVLNRREIIALGDNPRTRVDMRGVRVGFAPFDVFAVLCDGCVVPVPEYSWQAHPQDVRIRTFRKLVYFSLN
jgi:hypothetical protein